MKRKELGIVITLLIYSAIATSFVIAQIYDVTIKGIYGNATEKMNWTAVNITHLTTKDIWKRMTKEIMIYEVRLEGNVLDAGKDWAILEDNTYAVNVRLPLYPGGKEFVNPTNFIGKRVEIEGIALNTWSGHIMVIFDSGKVLEPATPSSPILLKSEHLNVTDPTQVLGRYVLARNQTLSNVILDSPQILNFTWGNLSYITYSPHYTFNVTEGNKYNITGYVNWYFGLEIFCVNLTEA